MPLTIENFEKDIIIDEVILQNKEAYILKDLDLLSVKEMITFYMDEYLSKNEADIGFDVALGSALNIGKLLINAADMNHDCVSTINSHMTKTDKKFKIIDEKYLARNTDLSDEIYAKSVFGVVPNYTMTVLSYIKMELLRSKKDELYASKIDIHRLSRVLELYLEHYNSSFNPKNTFRLMSESDLFSIGNLYLHFIVYILQNSLTSEFNHQIYTLVDFVDKKDIHMNDILYFIDSFDRVKEFNELDLSGQVEFAKFYRWFSDEVYEAQKIGKKIVEIVEKKGQEKGFNLKAAEALVLKAKVEESLNKLRMALYNNYKKYYNVGIDLGGDYVFETMRDIITVIETDIDYICNDKAPNLDRSCLYYGDMSLVERLFLEDDSIVSILEANNKGD